MVGTKQITPMVFALLFSMMAFPCSSIVALIRPQAERPKDEISQSKEQPTPDSASRLSAKEARGAEIDADSERLVHLAEELRAELAKSGKDSLSLQMLKKASEVEKLARSLKEKLKHE